MSYDTFFTVLVLIGALSGLFMLLAVLADLLWPAIERLWRARQPRPQASYRRRHP